MQFKRDQYGLNKNDEQLLHLRFSNDMILSVQTIEHLQSMLIDLERETLLKLKHDKLTKIDYIQGTEIRRELNIDSITNTCNNCAHFKRHLIIDHKI